MTTTSSSLISIMFGSVLGRLSRKRRNGLGLVDASAAAIDDAGKVDKNVIMVGDKMAIRDVLQTKLVPVSRSMYDEY